MVIRGRLHDLRIIFLLVFCAGCADVQEPAESPVVSVGTTDVTTTTSSAEPNPERNAYFGDLHVHTANSFDAFVLGTLASPEDAYRFAKGETIRHPAGFEMKLREPLDFYAVTDHAFFLGITRAMADPASPMSKHPDARALTTVDTQKERMNAFRVGGQFSNPKSPRFREIDDPATSRAAWEENISAANRHNDPGRFTTFIAYEYTSYSGRQNLHRNVIFKGATAPEIPFSQFDSDNPEDLWAWMDGLREQGMESLAIPHNSNLSNGQMFSLLDYAGNPFDTDYASMRIRNEPLVEISQTKGTSETHPALSPNDEWAEFEIMRLHRASRASGNQLTPTGSYVREAQLNGLKMAEQQGFDPFKVGVIGSSDTHNGTSSGDESDYWGVVGKMDGDGVSRGSVPNDTGAYNADSARAVTFGASGLAGVWAEQNTRDAIYEAMRRKETFGTSGAKIKVRLFAGYDLPTIDSNNLANEAYAGGVPMGADLVARDDQVPAFIVWALRDPLSAPLQRVQIIKGWIAEGEVQEKVFDVACSDGGVVDPVTHRCPDNNAKVNLADCSIVAGTGAPELKARWRDPEFDANQRAFYYTRVLENPTCRWSTWDALRAGVEPREGVAKTIQERAWSSPIWYVPLGSE